MKIVKNVCYGGFSISPKAIKRLAELQGRECYFFKGGYFFNDGLRTPWEEVTMEEAETELMRFAFSVNNPNEVLIKEGSGIESNKKYNEIFRTVHLESSPENRTDPLLIQVIEELGEEANSRFSRLEIVEIPDELEWEIDDNDGYETIREKGRSW